MEMHPGRFQTTNTTPAAHQHNNTGSEHNTINQLQAANLWINNMRQHLKVSNNNLRILIEDRETRCSIDSLNDILLDKVLIFVKVNCLIDGDIEWWQSEVFKQSE